MNRRGRRNLQQKLWRLNWTSLLNKSTNQPPFLRRVYRFVIPLSKRNTFDFSWWSTDEIMRLYLNRYTFSMREVLQWLSQFVRYFTSLLSIALVPSSSRHCSALFHLLSPPGWLAKIHGIMPYCGDYADTVNPQLDVPQYPIPLPEAARRKTINQAWFKECLLATPIGSWQSAVRNHQHTSSPVSVL